MTKHQSAQVGTLAIGDRLGLIRQLIGFIGKIDPEMIKKLLDLFGGSGAAFGKIFDVIKLVLDLFKQPTTASLSESDADEKLQKILCDNGVSQSEFDATLKALAGK